jgi:hypothetical protein
VISCTSPLSAEAVSEDEESEAAASVSVLPESVAEELSVPVLLPQPLKSVATIAADKIVANNFFLIENPPFKFVCFTPVMKRTACMLPAFHHTCYC